MKRVLVIFFLAVGLLLLTSAAWAVQGVRWVLMGPRRRRRPFATA